MLPPESRIFMCKKAECRLITVFHQDKIAYLQKTRCNKHAHSCKFCLTHGHCNDVGQPITHAMTIHNLVWYEAAMFQWEYSVAVDDKGK